MDRGLVSQLRASAAKSITKNHNLSTNCAGNEILSVCFMWGVLVLVDFGVHATWLGRPALTRGGGGARRTFGTTSPCRHYPNRPTCSQPLHARRCVPIYTLPPTRYPSISPHTLPQYCALTRAGSRSSASWFSRQC